VKGESLPNTMFSSELGRTCQTKFATLAVEESIHGRIAGAGGERHALQGENRLLEVGS